ncbi:MAG TPA: PHP domain-containing protein [Ilumatobacteraceae bacterium]|nr:PHP domain-containing protein [Ilumatobacteraceae bacterium]
MIRPIPSAEAVARHPHLAHPRPDGTVRVDLHTHTMWSGDSTTTPEEFAAAVTASGLDVVCITDHNAIAGALELRDRVDARVIVGEELRTAAGEIIGLFLTERIPMGIGPIEAARAIRDQGGVVYIPHPFDPMRRNLTETALYELAEHDLIDAVEVLNAKTSLGSLNRRAAEFAAEFGIVGGAGSDGHVPDALGAAYVEMPDFATPMEFLAALASATVVGHHWDEPRPWSPRIVPSVAP